MQADRPFRIAFLITSMPVGGAETLLVNLMRSMKPQDAKPIVVCLKEPGPLGEQIQDEFPVFSNLIQHKLDVGVIFRLRKLLRQQEIDAVVTVGAGDKMFWGRIAAYLAGTPVILSALHSTGWPDGVGRLNRMLTKITDGFIGVAKSHGQFLVDFEKFPESKVFVINNGIDTDRFRRNDTDRKRLREQWGFAEDVAVCGVVAALRPEKNLRLFLDSANLVHQKNPKTGFVITGSGPEENQLKEHAAALGLEDCVRFLGSRSDVPAILSGLDMFALSSDNEASPVSILEAMSCGLPVVCTDVGSVKESVLVGKTGWVVPVGQAEPMADRWLEIMGDSNLRSSFGETARKHVLENNSLQSMTGGYLDLIRRIYFKKRPEESLTAETGSTQIAELS